MFVVKWLYNKTLNLLGLESSKKQARILFLGLDNAGKSTLLHMMCHNKIALLEPTRHPQFEQLIVGNLCFNTYDLGGHVGARQLWKQYFASSSVDGIVFLVDSSDPKRFAEAKSELNGILSDDLIRSTPVLVLGNKMDAKQAVGESQLVHELGLSDTVTGKQKPTTALVQDQDQDQDQPRAVEVFMCSIVKRQGFTDGFRWLSEHIK